MDFLEIFLIAVALSMDAFSVSAACAISRKKISLRQSLIIAGTFGFFQFAMPLIGWSIGEIAYDYISAFSKWIAFFILAIIGAKMIFDSLRCRQSCTAMFLAAKTLLMLAVATSLDALSVGILFSCLDSEVMLPSIIIGVTTFIISLMGIKLGNFLGSCAGGKFEILGGLVLIAIGLKILFF